MRSLPTLELRTYGIDPQLQDALLAIRRAYELLRGDVSLMAAQPQGVTSVGLILPASLFTVVGSPVTSSGNLEGDLIPQSANSVFAGPTSGAPAVPAFRQLVLADIPLIDLASHVTGILPVGNGGTGTSNPSLQAGTGIQITGTWPNQTISAVTGPTATPYDVVINVPGPLPSGMPFGLFAAVRNASFPANFVGSVAVALRAPAGQTSFAIYKLPSAGTASQVGTLTMYPGGTSAFSTGGNPVALSPGDLLYFLAPQNPDPQLALMTITLKGSAS
jgi:hypothetical protein